MEDKSYKTVMLNAADHVAVALEDIPEGAVVTAACGKAKYEVRLKQEIAFGHKFAVQFIAQGGEIRKYGEVIGRATRDIAAGEHVHVHNLEGIRGRGDRLDGNGKTDV